MANPTPAPTAALLVIGAEVLSGKVADENIPFLARRLRQRGIALVEVRIVDDTIAAIAEALNALRRIATTVFTTGGIGPTHDDVTYAGVAHALGVPLEEHQVLADNLRQHYVHAPDTSFLKMAQVPRGAEVLLITPRMAVVSIAGVVIFPGVPHFAQMCFEQIAERFVGPKFEERALYLNCSESDIAHHLETVQHQYPQVAIGSYPRFDNSSYRVKLTFDGRDAVLVDQAVIATRRGLQAHWIVEG